MSKHRSFSLRLAPGALLALGLVWLTSFESHARQVQTPPRSASPGSSSDVRSLNVTGTGKVSLEPDVVEIAFRVRARAKTIDEALQDFRGKRQLFDKVLADFADMSPEVASRGVRLGTKQSDNNVVRFNNEEAAAPPFETKEILELRMPMGDDGDAALATVAELVAAMGEIDCEIDGVDPNSRVYYSNRDQEQLGPIRFIVSDEALKDARAKALDAAYADAVAQAERLATLADGKVGRATYLTVTKSFGEKTATTAGTQRELSLMVRFEMD